MIGAYIIFALGFLVCAAGIVWLIRSLYLSHTRAFGHAEPTTAPDDRFDDLATDTGDMAATSMLQAAKIAMVVLQDIKSSIRVLDTEQQLWDLCAQQNVPKGTLVFLARTHTLYVLEAPGRWAKV
jgi:hypothetical protein